jgi:hypothetical protein
MLSICCLHFLIFAKPNFRQVPQSSPADTQLMLLKTVPFKQKIWISKLRWVTIEEAGEASWNIAKKIYLVWK